MKLFTIKKTKETQTILDFIFETEWQLSQIMIEQIKQSLNISADQQALIKAQKKHCANKYLSNSELVQHYQDLQDHALSK